MRPAFNKVLRSGVLPHLTRALRWQTSVLFDDKHSALAANPVSKRAGGLLSAS